MAKMGFSLNKAAVVTATLEKANIPFTTKMNDMYCIVESPNISTKEFKKLCEYASIEQNAPFPRLPLSLAVDRPLREKLFGHSAILMNENTVTQYMCRI